MLPTVLRLSLVTAGRSELYDFSSSELLSAESSRHSVYKLCEARSSRDSAQAYIIGAVGGFIPSKAWLE